MPQRPRTQEYRRTSIGSGFVLHPDGYIVTNAHVVARTTDRKAIFADGSEYDAQLLAIDTNRDLAVLKISADHSLPALALGRSDDLMIGETVIAIGNPLGYQHTVTAGIVSAVNRDLEFGPDQTFKGLLQTDASINPGNSGGPLLNVLGELIGINTAVRSDAQNIGFAIPVDQLRELLPELLDIERRYDISVGMTIGNLDAPRVISVQDGSPAHDAGIQPGDVLTRVDDDRITQGVDYYIDLIGRKAGSTIRLACLRGNKP
jgi:serine protease Do